MKNIRNEQIDKCANLMADILVGRHDILIEQSGSQPIFGPREDLAYLHGYRAIEYLPTQFFGTRRLISKLKSRLANAGMAQLEVEINLAKFWIYYWTMMVGHTALNGAGAAHRLALFRVRRSKAVLERLKFTKGRKGL